MVDSYVLLTRTSLVPDISQGTLISGSLKRKPHMVS